MIKDPTTGALQPGSIHHIASFLNDHKITNIDLIGFDKPIDSVNFNKSRIIGLVKMIAYNYMNYDAFLVIMGTDTMCYVSSMVSFMIENLNKPILFTGSQKPLSDEASDAKRNLLGAITYLKHEEVISKVGIYFNQKWHLAVRTTKIDTLNNDAYFETQSISNRIIRHVDALYFNYNISSEVIVVKLDPFMDEDILLEQISNPKLSGVVLELLGSGNLPKYSNQFNDKVKQLIKKGLKIAIVSQCLKGKIESGLYQSSLINNELGLLNGANMTTESALAKLTCLLSKSLNEQSFEQEFIKSAIEEIY